VNTANKKANPTTTAPHTGKAQNEEVLDSPEETYQGTQRARRIPNPIQIHPGSPRWGADFD